MMDCSEDDREPWERAEEEEQEELVGFNSNQKRQREVADSEGMICSGAGDPMCMV